MQINDMAQRRCYPLSFIFFVLGINIIFMFYVQRILNVFPSSLIYHAGHGLLSLSLLAAFHEWQWRKIKYKYQVWLLLVACAALFALLVGLARGALNDSPYYLTTDIYAFSYFCCLIVAADEDNWGFIDKMLTIQFAVAALLSVYCWKTSGRAILREDAIQAPIYIAWALMYPWPYFFVTIGRGGLWRKAVATCGLCVFFVLSVMFLKRTPVVMAAVLLFGVLVVYVLMKFRQAKNKKTRGKRGSLVRYAAIIVFVLVLGGVIVKSSGILSMSDEYGSGYGVDAWYSRLQNRGTIYDTVLQDYRLTYEPHAVLHGATIFDLVFGKGLGATIPVSVMISADGRSGELHNGMLKPILKGGLVLFIIYYLGWLILAGDFLRNSRKELIPFYLVVLVSVVFSIVSPLLTNSLAAGLILLCAGRCMSREKVSGG